MVATEQKQPYIGRAMKRKEDPRFITGRGNYLDDIVLANMLHAAIVRSPFAHARIRSIDTGAAAGMPGVVGVFTGEDIELPPLPYAWQAAGVENNVNTPSTLAKGEVHWVGDPIAVVVAETIQQARDAAEAIELDLEELPAVSDAEKAVQPGAPQLHENAPNNIVFTWSCGKQEETDEGLRNAEATIRQKIRKARTDAAPIPARPADLDASIAGNGQGFKMYDAPQYRVPQFVSMIFGATAPQVAIAKGAVDEFHKKVRGYVSPVMGTQTINNIPSLVRLAQAKVRVDAAEQYLYSLARRLLEWASEGPLTPEQRVMVRSGCAWVANESREIVQFVAATAGSSAFMRDQPMQRYLRDITMMANHFYFDQDTAFEPLGRVMVGLDANTRLS